MNDDRINDQLADLKAGQATQAAETRGVITSLRDMNATLKQIMDDHEKRMRRLEWAVTALTLGAGSAAAKVMGFL